jgi:predicted dehydrogenase
MNKTINVGIIGCGNICNAYFKGSKPYNILNIVACADLMPERAQATAKQHGVPRACTVDELIADPNVDVVLNLTVPNAHAAVNRAAIAAGKSVYTEKPFATNLADAKQTLDDARKKNLRAGSAPDTFLGGGIQTCIKLVRDGVIGEPVAATAFVVGHGMEHWHPNPDFFFQPGGGPMFDMGPYYITALVNLIGPVKRVTGMARATFPERTITSQPRHGQKIKVTTPTHITGSMEFANGALGTIVTSWDVWGHHLPRIEVHGTEASLVVPDPNCFGGPVQIKRANDKDWSDVPLMHSDQVGRGIGLADMAYGLVHGRPHRCNGDLAAHVVDVMSAFTESAIQGRHIATTTTCTQPAPLPVGLTPGELDT